MTAVAQRPTRDLDVPKIGGTGWRTVLLLCGAAATALYVALDTVAAILYDGYSYAGQTISELSAVGAPTRPLWVPAGFVYAILTIAFAFGVWMSAGGRLALRAIAGMVGVIGVLGLVAWPFAPMHQREVLAAGGGNFSDTLHIILGVIDSTIFMLAIAVGALAFRGAFRMYSIVTLAVVLVAGALTGMESPKVPENEATPWIGITERIALFGSMAWLAVLAIVLMRRTARE